MGAKSNNQKDFGSKSQKVSGGRSRKARRGRPRRSRARRTPGARDELIAIHKEITRQLQREIEGSVGKLTPDLQRYYKRYWKELESFEAESSRSELLRHCRGSGLVYCGDYHSLRASQQTAHALVRALSDRGRRLTVAIEMVHTDKQVVLDAYQDELIDEAEFLRAIDYQNTWDFHWPPYRKLLELCKQRELRVIAINTEPDRASDTPAMEARDRHAAKLIAAEVARQPEVPIFVFDGDLHVVSEHLPKLVDDALTARDLGRRSTIVHQNAEPIYWQLADLGREREVNVVRIREGVFCVLSATPLVKLQSYLSWQLAHHELCEYVDPVWRFEDDDCGPDYAEQVHGVVNTISSFLGVEGADGLDNFTVYTNRDLDLLHHLEDDEELPAHVIDEVKAHIRENRSYFVPGRNVIYLANLSLYAAAEEATHFINCTVGGYDPSPREVRDAFYVRVFREALGFFGSRIIDPQRAVMTERDLAQFLEENYGRRLDEPERRLRDQARHVLRHLEAERIDLRPRPKGFRRRGPRREPIFRLAPADQDAVAHLLGYMLGDKLHAALRGGLVTRAAIRHLFRDPLSPGAAEKLYLALNAHLRDVEHDLPDADERFGTGSGTWQRGPDGDLIRRL